MSERTSHPDADPATPAEPVPPREWAARATFVLAMLGCLHPLISPAIALTIGLVVAGFLGTPFPWLTKRGSKILLQCSVVLLGFRMDLGEMAREAVDGSLFAVATIAGTLLLAWGIGRLLSVDRDTGMLIGGGTAICGGSAIAAIAPAIAARSAAIAVAIGTVFILNAVALYVFPIVGKALELSAHQFGTWCGVAIHDVSSVVGAAKTHSDEALSRATTVKLARTLWIVPLVLGAGWLHRRQADAEVLATGEPPARPKIVPLFIILFVIASALRTMFPWVETQIAPDAVVVAKRGLVVTLFLIGTGLSIATIRSVGPRAMILGVALWIAISAGSLVVILMLGGDGGILGPAG